MKELSPGSGLQIGPVAGVTLLLSAVGGDVPIDLPRSAEHLARRRLPGSWLNGVISLLSPATLCGFARHPSSSEHFVENVGRH